MDIKGREEGVFFFPLLPFFEKLFLIDEDTAKGKGGERGEGLLVFGLLPMKSGGGCCEFCKASYGRGKVGSRRRREKRKMIEREICLAQDNKNFPPSEKKKNTATAKYTYSHRKKESNDMLVGLALSIKEQFLFSSQPTDLRSNFPLLHEVSSETFILCLSVTA